MNMDLLPDYIKNPGPAPVTVNQPHRILTCDICEADTPHTLTEDKSLYVCDVCSREIIYIIAGRDWLNQRKRPELTRFESAVARNFSTK